MSKNEEMKLLDEHYKKYCEEMEIEFYKKFKINKKVLDFDVKDDLNEIIVHHYFISRMKKNFSFEIEATLREIELRTGLGFQQVRTSINKLEKLLILEINRCGFRTPSIYKYITN